MNNDNDDDDDDKCFTFIIIIIYCSFSVSFSLLSADSSLICVSLHIWFVADVKSNV